MSTSEQLKAIQGRWESFAAKVGGRLEEVLAEADAGFAEVIAAEALDPAPLSGALTEFEARIRGLTQKVDEAFEKLDHELDAVVDEAEGAQLKEATKFRDDLLRKRQSLRDQIEGRGQQLSIKKAADGARALWELAKQEMEQADGGRKCSGCGAPIRPQTLTEASNVTCQHCQAVNTVHPGAATALFFGGIALHSLATETALPHAPALAAAEKHFRSLRYPTDADVARYLEGTLAYWRVYCEAFGKVKPGWSPDQLEADANAKIGYLKDSFQRDCRERNGVTAALKLAAAGDRAGIDKWLATTDSRVSLDELLVAAHEHGDRKSLDLLLDLAWKKEGSDEPAAAWKAEKVKELDSDFARR